MRTHDFSIKSILYLFTTTLYFLIAPPGATEIYFSEYIEGSSFNKALEIHNSGTEDIDFDADGYRIDIYFNCNINPSTTLQLKGTLPAGNVFVIAETRADPAILAQADQLTSASLYNGDDAIVLIGNEQIKDSIGQIGFDPGLQWGSGLTSTQNNTLRRLYSIEHGDDIADDTFDPANQWEGFENNTFTDIGQYQNDQSSENCGEPATLISTIQGDTNSSQLIDTIVSVEAIVVGDFQGEHQLSGFFVQEENSDQDNNPNSSEGLFIYYPANTIDVAVGDHVRVKGRVTEYRGLTELSTISQINICAVDQILPTPAQIQLPISNIDDLETFEGMSIELPQVLTISENYNLGRYGEVLLSNGRLFNPSNEVLPGDDAIARQAQNNLNQLLMDDGLSIQNPESIIFPAPGLSADNTLRSSDSVMGIHGVMHFAFNTYRIIPTITPVFTATNPRPHAPQFDNPGRLKAASFNVLNFFNGDGLGGGFPTARGADTDNELKRQRDKIVNAVIAVDADIIGLIEIENDGYAEHSAIAELVNAINDALIVPEDHYAYVTATNDIIGDDEIAVGIIYRKHIVSPSGAAAILTSANSIEDPDNPGQPLFLDSKNRPALAQTFTEIQSNAKLTVVVNHFKSKGSPCDDIGDPDLQDGQGNCNKTRNNAARALIAWLNSGTNITHNENILILGDLNAYAKEDPITTLSRSHYTNLAAHFDKPQNRYSYTFKGQAGTLDYAFANPNLLKQVNDTTIWHINSDEPRALDYNEEFKSDNQLASLYSPSPYRSSDHDPVIVSMTLTPPNQNPIAQFKYFRLFRWVVFISKSTDHDGHINNHHWDFGDGRQSSGKFTIHRYQKSGHYKVTHTVHDNQNASDSLQTIIHIR